MVVIIYLTLRYNGEYLYLFYSKKTPIEVTVVTPTVVVIREPKMFSMSNFLLNATVKPCQDSLDQFTEKFNTAVRQGKMAG